MSRACRCGASLEGRRSNAKWCSVACRSHYYRVDNPDYVARQLSIQRKRYQDQEKDRRVVRPQCRYCPNPVSRGGAILCQATECKRRHTNDRNAALRPRYKGRSYVRANNAKQSARRRALLAATDVETFDPTEIFERDQWTCHLCGELADQDAKVPAYKAPTLDHVIPLAHGGPHTRDNVRCAHFICNSRRQNKPMTSTNQ